MPISFPQFIKIRDFDHYEKDSLQTEVEDLSSKYKNHNLCETQDSQNYQTQPSSPKLYQNIPSQLSFQKWFMNEHLQSFDFQVKIYLEAIFQDQAVNPQSFSNEGFFGKKSQSEGGSCPIEFYLRSNDCLMRVQESQILMEKLRSRQKLRQFMEQICYKACDQIALEFLRLGKYVLEEYQKIENQELGYQNLINLIRKMVEQNWQTIKIKSNLQFLSLKQNNYRHNNSTLKNKTALRKFIEFLITTLFLIASEYVNNPYYPEAIQTQLKRHIFYNNNLQSCDYDTFSSSGDDSDDQFFSLSKKKRK